MLYEIIICHLITEKNPPIQQVIESGVVKRFVQFLSLDKDPVCYHFTLLLFLPFLFLFLLLILFLLFLVLLFLLLLFLFLLLLLILCLFWLLLLSVLSSLCVLSFNSMSRPITLCDIAVNHKLLCQVALLFFSFLSHSRSPPYPLLFTTSSPFTSIYLSTSIQPYTLFFISLLLFLISYLLPFSYILPSTCHSYTTVPSI